MNNWDFTHALRQTRIRARVAKAARHVLVKRWSQNKAARVCGLNRVSVCRAVNILRRIHESLRPVAPAHWVEVRVTVPAETAARIREAEAAAMAALA